MSAPRAPARLFVTAIAWILIALIGGQVAVGLLSILASGGGDSFGTALVASIAVFDGVVCVVGLVSGVGLLLRKRWARTSLELLTWGCCGICVAAAVFGAYLFVTWSDPSDRWVPVISIVGYPLVLAGLVPLLWALRSQEMREALQPAAQQAHRADAAS